jgi:hypothetical protein
MSSNAASAGAQAQTNASNAAIAEQNKIYGENTANAQPYLNAGSNAVNLENQYLSGNTSGFANSPDYQFALSQGEKASTANGAASGNVWGGGQTADAISLGQGLATQYANNYWNKISGVAQQGNSASSAFAGVGQQTANQIGAQENNIGQANASSYAGQANAVNSTLGQLGNIYGQYTQNQSSYTPTTYGSSSGNGYNVS